MHFFAHELSFALKLLEVFHRARLQLHDHTENKVGPLGSPKVGPYFQVLRRKPTPRRPRRLGLKAKLVALCDPAPVSGSSSTGSCRLLSSWRPKYVLLICRLYNICVVIYIYIYHKTPPGPLFPKSATGLFLTSSMKVPGHGRMEANRMQRGSTRILETTLV